MSFFAGNPTADTVVLSGAALARDGGRSHEQRSPTRDTDLATLLLETNRDTVIVVGIGKYVVEQIQFGSHFVNRAGRVRLLSELQAENFSHLSSGRLPREKTAVTSRPDDCRVSSRQKTAVTSHPDACRVQHHRITLPTIAATTRRLHHIIRPTRHLDPSVQMTTNHRPSALSRAQGAPSRRVWLHQHTKLGEPVLSQRQSSNVQAPSAR